MIGFLLLLFILHFAHSFIIHSPEQGKRYPLWQGSSSFDLLVSFSIDKDSESLDYVVLNLFKLKGDLKEQIIIDHQISALHSSVLPFSFPINIVGTGKFYLSIGNKLNELGCTFSIVDASKNPPSPNCLQENEEWNKVIIGGNLLECQLSIWISHPYYNNVTINVNSKATLLHLKILVSSLLNLPEENLVFLLYNDDKQTPSIILHEKRFYIDIHIKEPNDMSLPVMEINKIYITSPPNGAVVRGRLLEVEVALSTSSIGLKNANICIILNYVVHNEDDLGSISPVSACFPIETNFFVFQNMNSPGIVRVYVYISDANKKPLSTQGIYLSCTHFIYISPDDIYLNFMSKTILDILDSPLKHLNFNQLHTLIGGKYNFNDMKTFPITHDIFSKEENKIDVYENHLKNNCDRLLVLTFDDLKNGGQGFSSMFQHFASSLALALLTNRTLVEAPGNVWTNANVEECKEYETKIGCYLNIKLNSCPLPVDIEIDTLPTFDPIRFILNEGIQNDSDTSSLYEVYDKTRIFKTTFYQPRYLIYAVTARGSSLFPWFNNVQRWLFNPLGKSSLPRNDLSTYDVREKDNIHNDLLFNEIFIGMHVRLGDTINYLNQREALLPFSTYMNHANQLRLRFPNIKTIVLATDNPRLIDILDAYRPDWSFIISNVIRVDGDQNAQVYMILNKGYAYNMTRGIIQDIGMLSRSSFYIGSCMSQVGRVSVELAMSSLGNLLYPPVAVDWDKCQNTSTWGGNHFYALETPWVPSFF